ncbi:Crp/Fnr family transcriptional regulator [Helicobacter aurati]|uniref:Crp/Fnr family transcriptional regulator n=1 Tax=Helicobacter aurati TaxID=137778 RepID=A0A3D8J9X7_9HELI|nr:Crp/Fnr family transcriptional regulator [Helicobacter aurati]RDU73701.1 Crp/Fnr family transcriptional regulator [Helicobacter aurati]
MQQLLESLTQIGHKTTYNANAIVFFENEKAERLFLLLRGKVRLYRSKTEIYNKETRYKEYTIHTLCAPNFIAEMPFFMESHYPANAQCVEQSEIISITLQAFKKHLQNSEFCLLFITSLCQKIRILESYITTQNQNLQTRFLHFLNTHQNILPTLTQKHIAQHLNTNPESLSRLIKSYKNKGLISTNKGKIIIQDYALLYTYLSIQESHETP